MAATMATAPVQSPNPKVVVKAAAIAVPRLADPRSASAAATAAVAAVRERLQTISHGPTPPR